MTRRSRRSLAFSVPCQLPERSCARAPVSNNRSQRNNAQQQPLHRNILWQTPFQRVFFASLRPCHRTLRQRKSAPHSGSGLWGAHEKSAGISRISAVSSRPISGFSGKCLKSRVIGKFPGRRAWQKEFTENPVSREVGIPAETPPVRGADFSNRTKVPHEQRFRGIALGPPVRSLTCEVEIANESSLNAPACDIPPRPTDR